MISISVASNQVLVRSPQHFSGGNKKMKTEVSGSTGDVIWSANVELPSLTHEECFPVIGSCQVSSILSNLDTAGADKLIQNNTDNIPQTMGLIVLQNNDYKINQTDLSNDYILLKDNNEAQTDIVNSTTVASSKPINNNSNIVKQNNKKVKKVNEDDFEKMLYFVCNLCPYLCIKDSKITEHLEAEHKNKTSASKPPQLKCPACPNIFFHKIPLRVHLIHDHKVNNSDLKRIIQAVVYFSKKSLNNSEEANKDEPPLSTNSLNYKNELDLKCIEKFMHTEKMINNEDSMSNDNDTVTTTVINENLGVTNSDGGIIEKIHLIKDSRCKDAVKIQENQAYSQIATLPLIDITHNDPEKTFSSIIRKRTDTLTKYIDQKNLHKCTVAMCKVRLQDPVKMAYHVKCHTEGTFKCPECDELFTFWKPMTGHLWRLHKIDMELYSCDKCDYKTFSLGKLNNIHKLIHSDLKSFVCEICCKGFKNLKQLRNHRVIHKDKQDKLIHICEVCTKAFSDRRQLRVHMDGVHKKIKPFLCSYCGYKGSSKSALKMHTRQHTGEKPFACDACDYTTADHNSLRRHKLRHTGQKPYKCAHCDYACIQSSTYKVHLRTKHPGSEKDFLFTCQDCPFKSVNQDVYVSHLFSMHRQKVTFH